MQHKFLMPVIIAFSILAMAGCSQSKKEGDANLNDKRARLEKLKGEQSKQNEEITKLQKELSQLDTSNANPTRVKLVNLTEVAAQNFDHYIELQGMVEAEKSAYIAPRGGGGLVRQIFVRQGDRVAKGQLLLKLDNTVQSQQVQAVREQSAGIKTQLTLARSLYERQKNLWDKGIGTEVQLITAKTNVTALENQLSSLGAQVNLAQEQARSANVYSEVSGVADIVNVRVGEMFMGGQQIRVVNTSSLKVTGNIPENYLGTVSKGTQVLINMPDGNRTYNSTISFVGASIDPLTRGFTVEAQLPSDPAIKPNQLALLKIRDYGATNAIAIPLKTLQEDQNGKYVMVAANSNGKLVATKRPVTIGNINNDLIEIKSGIKVGDKIITEGYSGLYEGQFLKTSM